MTEPNGSTEPRGRELAGFTFSLLLGVTAAIALAWLAVDFKDRADHLNYWDWVLVMLPTAFALLAISVWTLRRTQVAREAPTRKPFPSDWWWPFYTLIAAAFFLAELWVSRGLWQGTVADRLNGLLVVLISAFLILLTRNGVVRWLERPAEVVRETGLGMFPFLLFYLVTFGLREFSWPTLQLGTIIAAVAALPLAGYMYTHRSPRLPPITKEGR